MTICKVKEQCVGKHLTTFTFLKAKLLICEFSDFIEIKVIGKGIGCEF
jgi:hypothetical protein